LSKFIAVHSVYVFVSWIFYCFVAFKFGVCYGLALDMIIDHKKISSNFNFGLSCNFRL